MNKWHAVKTGPSSWQTDSKNVIQGLPHLLRILRCNYSKWNKTRQDRLCTCEGFSVPGGLQLTFNLKGSILFASIFQSLVRSFGAVRLFSLGSLGESPPPPLQTIHTCWVSLNIWHHRFTTSQTTDTSHTSLHQFTALSLIDLAKHSSFRWTQFIYILSLVSLKARSY